MAKTPALYYYRTKEFTQFESRSFTCLSVYDILEIQTAFLPHPEIVTPCRKAEMVLR